MDLIDNKQQQSHQQFKQEDNEDAISSRHFIFLLLLLPLIKRQFIRGASANYKQRRQPKVRVGVYHIISPHPPHFYFCYLEFTIAYLVRY